MAEPTVLASRRDKYIASLEMEAVARRLRLKGATDRYGVKLRQMCGVWQVILIDREKAS